MMACEFIFFGNWNNCKNKGISNIARKQGDVYIESTTVLNEENNLAYIYDYIRMNRLRMLWTGKARIP